MHSKHGRPVRNRWNDIQLCGRKQPGHIRFGFRYRLYKRCNRRILRRKEYRDQRLRKWPFDRSYLLSLIAWTVDALFKNVLKRFCHFSQGNTDHPSIGIWGSHRGECKVEKTSEKYIISRFMPAFFIDLEDI